MKFVARFRLLSTFAAVGAVLSLTPAAHALEWFDDWSDGDFTDGIPETWTPLPVAPDDYDASSGDLILTGVNEFALDEPLLASVNDKVFGVTSVRTRAVVDDRSADPDNTTVGNVGVVARYDPLTASGYVAILDDGDFLTVFRADFGFESVRLLDVPDSTYTASSDVMIQLDVTDTGASTLLEITLWDPADRMPSTPQFFATDDVGGLETGAAGIFYVENNSNESSGVFRFAQAADTKIVDSFFEADFDGDGDVDGDDFLRWQTGFGTTSGAEKLDGDYDNDGDVDGDDFLGWQDEFGSESGVGSAAVPEPASAVLAAVLALVAGFRLRRRSA